MPGGSKAPKSGDDLKERAVSLAQSLGLKAKTEAKAARRIWGQERRIDIVISDPKSDKRLGIKCKFQASRGTAEEKVPATLQDISHWPIPGIVVIDGPGFSPNMQGYLMATGKVIWFQDLEAWLRLYFGIEDE